MKCSKGRFEVQTCYKGRYNTCVCTKKWVPKSGFPGRVSGLQLIHDKRYRKVVFPGPSIFPMPKAVVSRDYGHGGFSRPRFLTTYKALPRLHLLWKPRRLAIRLNASIRGMCIVVCVCVCVSAYMYPFLGWLQIWAVVRISCLTMGPKYPKYIYIYIYVCVCVQRSPA